jgi:FAD/FMN-containing dehydrogenase
MGNSASAATPFGQCIGAVCGSRAECVGYPEGDLLYSFTWARPFNLDLPVTPIAVVRPDNADEVSKFVTCAVDNDIKVQARSGGHSYA